MICDGQMENVVEIYQEIDEDEPDDFGDHVYGEEVQASAIFECSNVVCAEDFDVPLFFSSRRQYESREASKKSQPRHSLVRCLENGCVEHFHKLQHLREHLVSVHRMEFTEEAYEFSCYAEFEEFRYRKEVEHAVSFAKARGQRKLKSGDWMVEYYHCNRGGRVRRVEPRTERSKACVTAKTNSTCLAYMKVRRSLSTDLVSVVGCFDHYGHAIELQHLRLQQRDRAAIARQIAEGVPAEMILSDCKTLAESDGYVSKINLLTRKDIWNIKKNIRNLKYGEDLYVASSSSAPIFVETAVEDEQLEVDEEQQPNSELRMRPAILSDGMARSSSTAFLVGFDHSMTDGTAEPMFAAPVAATTPFLVMDQDEEQLQQKTSNVESTASNPRGHYQMCRFCDFSTASLGAMRQHLLAHEDEDEVRMIGGSRSAVGRQVTAMVSARADDEDEDAERSFDSLMMLPSSSGAATSAVRVVDLLPSNSPFDECEEQPLDGSFQHEAKSPSKRRVGTSSTNTARGKRRRRRRC